MSDEGYSQEVTKVMPKPKKIGKDTLGKKGRGEGILSMKDFEEWKQRKQEEEVEEEEQKPKKKAKRLIKSRITEDKEPTAEELEKQKAEVTAGIRRLKVKKVVLKEEEE